MPTAVQKTAELGSHKTHGEQQQQQQPQPDENSNSYNNNKNNKNNKGYCLVAPVDCSSARGEYRSCCAANLAKLSKISQLAASTLSATPLWNFPPAPFHPQRRSTVAWRSPDWWFVYFDWVKISFSTRAARRFRQCGRSKVSSPSRGIPLLLVQTIVVATPHRALCFSNLWIIIYFFPTVFDGKYEATFYKTPHEISTFWYITAINWILLEICWNVVDNTRWFFSLSIMKISRCELLIDAHHMWAKFSNVFECFR